MNHAKLRITHYASKAALLIALAACHPNQADAPYIFNGKSLEGWEVLNFGPQGPVSVKDGKICLEMGDGCTGIAWKGEMPRMNYTFALEAKRTEGHDFFCGVTFPVNDDYCTLIVGGWGGTTVGLSSIDQEDASENETNHFQVFENNRWYAIQLEVANEKIIATIDKDTVVNFTFTDRELSIRSDIQLSTPLGLTTWCTSAEMKNIQLHTNDKNE